MQTSNVAISRRTFTMVRCCTMICMDSMEHHKYASVVDIIDRNAARVDSGGGGGGGGIVGRSDPLGRYRVCNALDGLHVPLPDTPTVSTSEHCRLRLVLCWSVAHIHRYAL
jgi:hypothetical protein